MMKGAYALDETPSGNSDLAVVVLNWRDEQRTIACVESLLADPKISLVIIVDNETRHRLSSFASARERVDLIELNENRGFAGGTNRGLELAIDRGFSWVGTINSDARVVSGSLADLCRWAGKGDAIGAVGPAIVGVAGRVQSAGESVAPLTASTRDILAPHSAQIDYLTWACVLLPASTLREVGLLNESFFMYWEDVEFGLRLRDRGFEMVVDDCVRVEHEFSASHESAGWRIDYYSALGLAMIARLRGGAWRLGTAFRVMGRVIVRHPWSRNGRAALNGYRFGLRMDAERPAWMHLRDAGVLSPPK